MSWEAGAVCFAWGALFGGAVFDFAWRKLYNASEKLHRDKMRAASPRRD